jgi:hypothetical protein
LSLKIWTLLVVKMTWMLRFFLCLFFKIYDSTKYNYLLIVIFSACKVRLNIRIHSVLLTNNHAGKKQYTQQTISYRQVSRFFLWLVCGFCQHINNERQFLLINLASTKIYKFLNNISLSDLDLLFKNFSPVVRGL